MPPPASPMALQPLLCSVACHTGKMTAESICHPLTTQRACSSPGRVPLKGQELGRDSTLFWEQELLVPDLLCGGNLAGHRHCQTHVHVHRLSALRLLSGHRHTQEGKQCANVPSIIPPSWVQCAGRNTTLQKVQLNCYKQSSCIPDLFDISATADEAVCLKLYCSFTVFTGILTNSLIKQEWNTSDQQNHTSGFMSIALRFVDIVYQHCELR